MKIRSGLTALSLAILAAVALAPAAEAKVYKLHLELTGKAEALDAEVQFDLKQADVSASAKIAVP